MENVKAVTFPQIIIKLQIDKLLIVLGAMFCLPLFFHVIFAPSQGALGAVWLPIFYAPLIAVICFRPHVALFSSMVAPTINMLFSGSPTLSMAKMLTVELMFFVIIAHLMIRVNKRFWATGVISYFIAKFISNVVLGIASAGVVNQPLVSSFLNVINNSIPGVLMLFLINIIAVQISENKN